MTFRNHWLGQQPATNRGLKSFRRSRQAHLGRLYESLEARRLLALSDFVINEFLADPASAALEGDANGDGTRDSSDDEFVELLNNGDDIDIGGWMISDSSSSALRHTFPSPTIVAAGQAVVGIKKRSAENVGDGFGRSQLFHDVLRFKGDFRKIPISLPTDFLS